MAGAVSATPRERMAQDMLANTERHHLGPGSAMAGGYRLPGPRAGSNEHDV